MQERTGGLVYLDQILAKVQKSRNRFVNEVSIDDCKRAIKKLDVFGNAFTLVPMGGGRYIVQSLPDGMSVDHIQVLKLAESNGGVVSYKLVLDELKWDVRRIENVFKFLLKEGIVWVDIRDEKTSYYFPSLFNQQ
jgi:ESCRT-II complex subunit VPS22